MQDLAGKTNTMKLSGSFKSEIAQNFMGGYSIGFGLAIALWTYLLGNSFPTDGEVGLTNRRGGHSGGGGAANIGNTVKGFIVGIILYFVAVAIVYTIGTSNIINNATINSQIKNVAYFMSVLGTIIGLIAGTVFILKLLGGF